MVLDKLLLCPGSCPPASNLLLDAVLEAEAGLVLGPNDLLPQFLESEAVAPIRRDSVSQLGLARGDMLGTWVGDPVQPKGLHEMNTRRHTRSFLVRSQGSGRSFPVKMQASGALEGSLCK